MERLIEHALTNFADYPIVLLVLYAFTFYFPRKASYFYGSILCLLIAYGLYRFNARFETELHAWLTTTNMGGWFYSFFDAQVPEDARDEAEKAFTSGIYFMLKLGVIMTLVIVPLTAKSRVKEAISNIGRRPAKDAPPTI